jgi:pimeloyl-ACP methyl ester carboxylesterase
VAGERRGGVNRPLPAYAAAVIAIDVSGEGAPLVLVHGVGTNRAVWRRVTPLLATGRLVAAPDLPGFGDSPAVGRGFALASAADALAEALAAELPTPFDLLGNSLGGAVALVLAGRRRGSGIAAGRGGEPRSTAVTTAAAAASTATSHSARKRRPRGPAGRGYVVITADHRACGPFVHRGASGS